AAGVIFVTSLLIASCAGLHEFNEEYCGGACPLGAKVCKNPTMMALAHDLDHLEDHIEKDGSATIKVPDVRGQARVTKYREEIEKVMAEDLTNFSETLQGRLARDDQAFFAQAVSLGAAVSSPAAVRRIPRNTLVGTNTSPTTSEVNQLIQVEAPATPGV